MSEAARSGDATSPGVSRSRNASSQSGYQQFATGDLGLSGDTVRLLATQVGALSTDGP